MRAAIYKAPGKIVLEEVPDVRPGRGEVVVKVEACSICGTDRKIFRYGHPKIREGEERILGHELAGEIVEVGPEVKGYRVGMRVAVVPNVGCGVCPVCREGLDQLCPDYNAFGITWPGGFAEYLRIPADAVTRGNLVEIPHNVSYTEAAVVEPLACCLNAYEAMNICPGDSVLIFGAGPMGNLHLLLNKHLGCGLTILVDVNPERLKFSQKLGADYVILNDRNLKQKVMDITSGAGVDAVIVASPVPQLVEQALEVVARNGKIAVFAGLPAGKELVCINLNLVHYQQVSMVGTTGSTRAQFRRAMRLVSESGLPVKKIITARIGLEDLPSVLGDDALLDRNMKVVVEPSRNRTWSASKTSPL